MGGKGLHNSTFLIRHFQEIIVFCRMNILSKTQLLLTWPVSSSSEAPMKIQMAAFLPSRRAHGGAGRALQENQVLPKLLKPSAGEQNKLQILHR